jgi:prevent-host-death family protein
MAAATFKVRCLRVIREVQATREPVVITKRGAPVVQVTPVASEKGDVFGFMAGELKIVGDIESPVILEKRSMFHKRKTHILRTRQN